MEGSGVSCDNQTRITLVTQKALQSYSVWRSDLFKRKALDRAIELLTELHPQELEYTNARFLGEALCSRAVLDRNVIELDRGLEVLHSALVWAQHTQRPSSIHASSYRVTESSSQVKEKEHFSPSPYPDPDPLELELKLDIMNTIAGALHARWDISGSVEDLMESISLRRLILQVASESESTSVSKSESSEAQPLLRAVRALSHALFLRFTIFPYVGDIRDAVHLDERALGQTSTRLEGDSDDLAIVEHFQSLCTLAQTLLVLWIYDNDTTHIDRAVELLREAVGLVDHDEPNIVSSEDLAYALNMLTGAMQRSFSVTESDIEECVELDTRALHLFRLAESRSGFGKAQSLASLAISLLVRYTIHAREEDWVAYQELYLELIHYVDGDGDYREDSETFTEYRSFVESSWAFFTLDNVEELEMGLGKHTFPARVRYGWYCLRFPSQGVKRTISISNSNVGQRAANRNRLNVFIPSLPVDPVHLRVDWLVWLRVKNRVRSRPDSDLIWSMACIARGDELPYLLDTGDTIPPEEQERVWAPPVTIKNDHMWAPGYYLAMAKDLSLIHYDGDPEQEEKELAESKMCVRLCERALEWYETRKSSSTLAREVMIQLALYCVDCANPDEGEGDENSECIRFLDDAVRYSRVAAEVGYEWMDDTEALCLQEALFMRWEILGQRSDLEGAVESLREVCLNENLRSVIRWEASVGWVKYARIIEEQTWAKDVPASNGLMQALRARVEVMYIDRTQSFNTTTVVVSMSSAAHKTIMGETTELFIERGEYDAALDAIDKIRGVLWNHVAWFRMERFRHMRWRLPDAYQRLRLWVAAAEAERELSPIETDARGWRYQAIYFNRHRREARLLAALTEAVSDVSSGLIMEKGTLFSRFARNGRTPIVVLSAGISRCDALIVRGGENRIEHVPLPEVNRTRLEALATAIDGIVVDGGRVCRGIGVTTDSAVQRLKLKGQSVKTESVSERLDQALKEIWACIVQPILKALGYTEPRSSSSLPRVWWCSTGPFSRLPIHAAGCYTGDNCLSIQDYVIPSYLPPYSRNDIAKADVEPEQSQKIKIVGMYKTKTPPWQDLPETAVELDVLERLTRGREDVLLRVFAEGAATPRNVLLELPSAHVFHVALHGTQAQFSLHSALLLSQTPDIDEEAHTISMTVLWLLETVRSLPHAELIFLSACQTSAPEVLGAMWVDEVVHLAAAMLFVGFKSAIATMWSINDEDGPVVAGDVYRFFLGETEGGAQRRIKAEGLGKDAAAALHSAIGKLRKQDVPPIRWVAFMHIGE